MVAQNELNQQMYGDEEEAEEDQEEPENQLEMYDADGNPLYQEPDDDGVEDEEDDNLEADE